MSQQRSDAAREASDYFNSLPIEQRKKLAPLLEDYRRMGIDEAQRAVARVDHKLKERMRSIASRNRLVAEWTDEGLAVEFTTAAQTPKETR